ncbi:MAG: DsrE family protein [Alphaproteobacteria bacterium]|nr:DsrE family protein [Alphaproteobacteria bacterium]MBU1561654.1 DsrE family protein [Alphaproteobacteria bacterium]MBU2302365.1 DsrE family protein [Alphaproteobacteria bacterium]MBU2368645.1 DsrE family protein [Alphaproteobacteria bacterium]
MFLRRTFLATSLLLLTSGAALADNFLIHIHTGPDNPTKAALGFLVALTAQNDGHHVDLFLAGDGAALITDEALSSVAGVGTGKLMDHFTALIAGDVRIYISGKSAEARNIAEQALVGKPAEFAMPAKLVQLAAAADVVLTY